MALLMGDLLPAFPPNCLCSGNDVKFQEQSVSAIRIYFGPSLRTDLRWRTPICENLRFSESICGFLWFSASSKCWNFQERGESAKICGFLRRSAFWGWVCHLSSVPLSALRLLISGKCLSAIAFWLERHSALQRFWKLWRSLRDVSCGLLPVDRKLLHF